MQEHDPTIPLVPYYDLPAGLMVPLVKVRMHKIWNKLIKLWKKYFCYGYHNLYTYSINKIPYQDVIGHPIFEQDAKFDIRASYFKLECPISY